jgi:hypothetical protein
LADLSNEFIDGQRAACSIVKFVNRNMLTMVSLQHKQTGHAVDIICLNGTSVV